MNIKQLRYSCMVNKVGWIPGGIESMSDQGPGCMGWPHRAEPETLSLAADNSDSQPRAEKGGNTVTVEPHTYSNIDLEEHNSVLNPEFYWSGRIWRTPNCLD